MTFPTATLQAADYTKLRSSRWYGAAYASLNPNNVVWSTRLSTDATGTTNAQISYGATITGSSSDVQVGMRVLIGTANDIRQATFDGRVRTAPSSALMGINETSATLTSGMYLWVVDAYPLRDKLSRPVGSPPVQYVDYDQVYQGLLPVAVGLQARYGGFINSSNKLRIAFDVSSSYAAESGATISSYLFVFAAGTATVISGSLSTAVVTVDLTEGFQNGKLVLTDSGGRQQIRHFEIHAHGSTYTPALSFGNISVQAMLDQGWSMSADAFADVSSVLDNTPITFWTQEWYNDTEGPINNNISAIGWLRSESDPAASDPAYSLLTSSSFTMGGIGPKLSAIEMQLLALSNVASPTVWDEINNLTPWRGIVHILQRHTTLLELVDLTFDDTSDGFLFPFLSTQGGNVQAAVQGIAAQINAGMDYAPDGAISIARDARFQDSTERNALLTYANWTSQDYVSISLQYTHEQTLGYVDADGAYLQTVADNVVAFKSRAPGLAQDIGVGVVGLNNQILTAGTSDLDAQDELNQRAGNQYEISSTPTYVLDVVHPDGYHFLISQRNVWFTWTLAGGTDNIRGISFTTSQRWLLENIDWRQDNNTGTRTPHYVYRMETAVGDPGTSIEIVPDGSIDLSVPAIPPLDPFPAFPDPPEFYLGDSPTADQMPPFLGQAGTGLGGHAIVAPRDGNTVMIWTSTQVWVTRSFMRASPIWTEITPDGVVTIRDCKFTNTGQGVIILADISGTTTWTQTLDFLVTNGGFTVVTSGACPGGFGVYGGVGVGWQSVFNCDGIGQENELRLTQTLAAGVYDQVIFTYTSPVPTNGTPHGINVQLDGAFAGSTDGAAGTDQTVTINLGGASGTVLRVDFAESLSLASNTIVLTKAVFSGTGGNPFTGGGGTQQAAFYISNPFGTNLQWTEGNQIGTGTYKLLRLPSTANNIMVYNPGGADIRLATDNGVTFGSAVSVGTTPGSTGGGDVNRVGTASIFAADQKARKATTLGGAYSDATGGGTTGHEPQTIYIPRYKFGGVVTNANLSSPDFLLGADGLVTGEALWKVTGGVATAITPSHAGTKALAFSADGANMNYRNGNFIAFLGKITGTAYLFTSANAGVAWSDRGSLSGVLSVRIRKTDFRATPALFLAGGSVLKYSKDGGATLTDKTKPVSSGLLGIEVLG